MLSAMPFNPGAAGFDVMNPGPDRGRPGAVACREKRAQLTLLVLTPASAEALSEAFRSSTSVSDYFIPGHFSSHSPMRRKVRLDISRPGLMWILSRSASNQFGTPMSLPSAGRRKRQKTGNGADTPDELKLVPSRGSQTGLWIS